MDVPDIKTPLPGPKAKAIIDRDRQFVSPSYTRDYPFVIARGEGAVVEDVDGNRFLDCAAGIAVNSTGVSHPDVVKAIADQAQKFIHMSGTDFYYEPQVRLAEELASIAPIDGAVRTFFGNSGTEATEAAIKLARYFTKRQGIIAFLGSFHGRSMGSLSLTASKVIQRRGFGPLHAGRVPRAVSRSLSIQRQRRSVRGAVSVLHPGSALRPARSLPTRSRRSSSNRSRAKAATSCRRRRSCRGCASWRPSTASCSSWTKCSRAWAERGRCSRRSISDLKADVVNIAKGIASGLPLGVTCARADVMTWPPGAHASTFGGNPVSCAAANATIKLLQGSVSSRTPRQSART